MKTTRLPALALLIPALAAFANADEKNPVPAPEKDPFLIPKINARLRYEYGGIDGKEDSNALTGRLRAGLLTAPLYGFSAYGEFEGTATPDEDAYNGAVTGDPARSVIADPYSYELNQLWLNYSPAAWLNIKGGRQEINHDGQRYIGTVAWRQNEQTYDAATITFKPMEGLEAGYSYIWAVNRIFGSEAPDGRFEDFQGDTHLFNTSYSKLPIGKLTAFAYLMDLGNTAGDASSNASFGLSLAGATPIAEGLKLAHYLEGGYQTDYADSKLDYQAWYAHAKLAVETADWSLGVGFEYLGDDNGTGYQFPLGTNHKFNGYADVFLSTPPDGLQDLYVVGTANLPWKLKGELAGHIFGGAGDGFSYGQEINAVLSRPIGKNLNALVKYAYYMADDYGADTQRVSCEVNYTF